MLKATALVITILIQALVLPVSAYPSPSGWSITVHTDKSCYHIGDKVYISGNLTFNGWPTQSVQVGISAQSSSSGTLHYFGTAETNNDGEYNSSFTLGPNAELGDYIVTTSAEGYTNQTSFLVTDALYIMASGDVEPPNAPISRNGDVYSLTDNVTVNSTSGIVIERDNTIVEGAGFTLNGKNLTGSNGICLTSANNITARNISIDFLQNGIYEHGCSNCHIWNTSLFSNENGIYFLQSNSNVVEGNNITENSHAGIWLDESQSNKIVDNNFINNTRQTFGDGNSSGNVWNNEYPFGGNFWSDYNGTDVQKGVFQNEPGSDGIGDTPYIIDENNTDEYPLASPTYVSTILFDLNMTSEGGGTTYPGSGVYAYAGGTTVPVTAEHDVNCELAYWELDGKNVGSANPLVILIDSNHTLSAIFRLLTHDLTISASAGGTTDPAPGSHTCINATIVSAEAIPYADYAFDHWEIDNIVISSNNPVNILMDDNHSLLAFFVPIYSLTIAPMADGITDPPCGTYDYLTESSVNVTAITNAGYSFYHWLLDGEEDTENPITIVMTTNHTLEVVFVDNIPPEINSPIQKPLENAKPYQEVTVSVIVTDIGSGVRNVTLWYDLNNGTEWTSLDMNETLPNTFSATLSGYEEYSLIAYKIAAYDNAGNNATKDNHGDYYRYNVVPELVPNMPSVPLMILSALASIFIRIFLILTFLMVRTLLR